MRSVQRPAFSATVRACVIGLTLTVVSGGWLAWNLPGSAQAQDAPEADRARELFEEGLALADQGNWSEAQIRFRRSLRLRRSHVVRFNLALALTHSGAVVEAASHFRALADSSASTRVREAARAELGRTEPRIAYLTVEVVGRAIGGVRVELDGRPIAPDIREAVDPGLHTLVVRSNSGDTLLIREEHRVTEGESSTVELRLPSLAEQAVSTPPSDGSTPAVVPTEAGQGGGDDGVWVALGVVLGVVVAAAITTLIVVLATSSSQAEPVEGTLNPSVVEFGP